jgi:hypothetical protein
MPGGAQIKARVHHVRASEELQSEAPRKPAKACWLRGGVGILPGMFVRDVSESVRCDRSSSLNPTCENLIRAGCADKTVFIGFPVHIDTTIGQCTTQSIKKRFVNGICTELWDV